MKQSAKFCRCIKSVRKTVKARRGSTKEKGAIAICVKSMLHTKGRTLKRFSCGKKARLITQKRKSKGGATTTGVIYEKWGVYSDRLTEIVNEPNINDEKFDSLMDEVDNDQTINFQDGLEFAQDFAITCIKLTCVECMSMLQRKGMTIGDFENAYSLAEQQVRSAMTRSAGLSNQIIRTYEKLLNDMKNFKQRILSQI
jgi:hypothetical protein